MSYLYLYLLEEMEKNRLVAGKKLKYVTRFHVILRRREIECFGVRSPEDLHDDV
jgi:hypothetical protein